MKEIASLTNIGADLLCFSLTRKLQYGFQILNMHSPTFISIW